MAVFVNEGKMADVFGPGMYKLTTQTLPVLTYLKNWDKLFESPFKSDVYFFSTRQQVDQQAGARRSRSPSATRISARCGCAPSATTAPHRRRQAVPHRDLAARATSTRVVELDGQLRGLVLQHISDAIAASGMPFLDLAANQIAFAEGAGHASWRPRSKRSA